MATTQKLVDPEGSRPIVNSTGKSVQFFRTWITIISRYVRELSGDVMADAHHRHSELSGSDGTPNPAIQIDADGILVYVTTKTPSAANSTGTAGMIAWDGSYIYVCTATDTWKRIGIATW